MLAQNLVDLGHEKENRNMKREILDTNVLLRFFVGDEALQQKEASLWFSEAEKGKRKIVLNSLVVAEATFVLESFYKKDRKEIAEVFEVFISQRWLDVPERDVLLGLWSWYIKGLHFVDSFLLSWASLSDLAILSFDKPLKRAENLMQKNMKE